MAELHTPMMLEDEDFHPHTLPHQNDETVCLGIKNGVGSKLLNAAKTIWLFAQRDGRNLL